MIRFDSIPPYALVSAQVFSDYVKRRDEVTMKYAVGDKAMLKTVEIVGTDAGDLLDIHVKFPSGLKTWLQSGDVEKHIPAPRPLKKGDRIRPAGTTTVFGTIEHIRGDYAWVFWDSGSPATYKIDELRAAVPVISERI
jgi:hypothetical protein